MSVLETSRHYQRVKEFMRQSEQSTPDVVSVPSWGDRIRMAKLILEEAFELVNKGLGLEVRVFDGVVASGDFSLLVDSKYVDMIEVIDGACDLQYVTTCVLVGCGVPDTVFRNEVDDNNLGKFEAGATIREDGKLLKPEGYPKPRIAELLGRVVAEQEEAKK